MPGMTFYLGTFTAVPSILYCLFSILSFVGLFKDGFSLPLTLFFAFALPLFTFFCNISMLYFGRLYRRNRKSSYWDWTSVCYSALILLDIAFIFTAVISRPGTSGFFIERHHVVFAAFAANVLIPFFLVPLPAAVYGGSCRKYFLVTGMLCYVLGMLLTWIASMIVMAQACDDRTIAVSLFNVFPFSAFLNKDIPRFFTLLSVSAIVLFVIGYVSHICIIKRYEEKESKSVFNRFIISFIIAPIAVYIMSFASSRSMLLSYNVTKDNFKIPFNAESLERIYYNEEKPDEAFWQSFNAAASSLGKGGNGAFSSMSSMIDKVERIPKCKRDFSDYIGGKSQDLESVFAYCRHLATAMRTSIESKESSEAMSIARRALKIDALLLGDVYASAGLWHIFVCKDIIQPFVKSGLASNENLQEIKSAMADTVDSVNKFYDGVNIWHSLCMDTLWVMRKSENRIDAGNGNYMPVPSLDELSFVFPQQYVAYCREEARGMSKAVKGENPVMCRMRDEAAKASDVFDMK